MDYEITPGENTEAPVRTDMFIMYGEKCVYFGFRAYDPDPSAIVAHLNDRDQAWSDDWVGIALDTFNDERRSLNFFSNPLGVQIDIIEYQGGHDQGWDAIWDSAGMITDWGYCVEMAIPFSSLRFQRSDEDQTWGIAAERNYPRNHMFRFSIFPIERNSNCYLCQATKIRGFAGASPGENIEITPTLTAVRTDERTDFPSGDFVTRDEKADVGLTTHWFITPNLTLVGTVNPDFSQVEADSLQLDINEPFALYFEEKRPFFTEGSDFYQTRIPVVYTRTLRDPIWGAKLSGKEGNHTIGSYFVQDDITNLLFPGNQRSSATSLAMRSSAAVFRYKYDIGNKHTLGLMMTDREGDDYFNRVGGFDGIFRFTSADTLKVQVLGSQTQYPDYVASEFGQEAGDFTDTAYEVRFDHSTRKYLLYAGFRELGTGFRADLGFLPKVDYETLYAGAAYHWYGDSSRWFSHIAVANAYQQFNNHDGNLLEREDYIQLVYEGPLQSHAVVQAIAARRMYNGVSFDVRDLFIHNCMTPVGNLHWGINLYYGDQIDFANTRLGKRFRLSTHASQGVGAHMRYSLSYTFEQMDIESEKLYTANLADGSLVYQFNARTFIRAILQYVDYDYVPELYTFDIDEERKRFFSQLLFSYKINPQTVLFLGYSDRYLGNQIYSLTQADRTFFMKIGYSWQL
jgi:hypothetical protein